MTNSSRRASRPAGPQASAVGECARTGERVAGAVSGLRGGGVRGSAGVGGGVSVSGAASANASPGRRLDSGAPSRSEHVRGGATCAGNTTADPELVQSPLASRSRTAPRVNRTRRASLASTPGVDPAPGFSPEHFSETPSPAHSAPFRSNDERIRKNIPPHGRL